MLASINTSNSSSYAPLDFILKLRQKFPIYGEKNSYGVFIQHDVHEFWSSFWSFLNISDEFSLAIQSKVADQTEPGLEFSNCLLLPITNETSFMEDSIKLALSDTNAAAQGSMRQFSILPRLLPLVFMRFMWKSIDKVQAKILKQVSYPKSFDILPFCNEELRSLIVEKRKDCGNYGKYSLDYVISHTGREADSGHYMAWARNTEDPKGEEWFKFDDDEVSFIKEDEVMRLSGGGGDRPTAYIVFYLPNWEEVKQ